MKLVLVFFSLNLYSESSPVLLENHPIDIIHKIQLLEEDGKKLDIDQVQSMSFMKYDKWNSKLEANKVYWGKFSVTNKFENGLSDINWVIDFPIVLTDVQLYKKEEGDNFSERRTGQFVPIQERSVRAVFKSNYIQLYVYPGETAEIFFRAETERKWATPQFDIEIMTARNFVKKLKNRRFGQGLFIGFMMMMLVYNLFLYFFSAKDAAYINYSIYILGIVLYSAYNSGDLADMTNSFGLPNHPKYSYLGKTSTYLVIFGYLHFLKSFLNLDHLIPKWGTLLRIILWINALAFLTDVILMIWTNFNYEISDLVTVGNAILFVLFIFSLCFVLFKTKHKSRLFIIAGILLMGVGASFTIIARINGVEYSTLSFQIGTILEIIIFSLGLVSRRRHIEGEKQKALFELEKSKLLIDQEKRETERTKQLEKIKSDLYANITHEFRTPIQIINGNLDFIQGHQKEKDIIKRSSKKMLRLVDQILDLSKLETQTLDVKYIQGDIVPFLNTITGSFQTLADSQGITLSFRSNEEKLIMDFDFDKMENIVYNLVSNALKFTPKGGEVNLTLSKKDSKTGPHAQLKVSDTGSGIDKNHLPNIFDRFYKSTINESDGWGIGLAHTYELTKLMNGTITVKSELNSGTHFVLHFPIKSEQHNDSALKTVPYKIKNAEQQVEFLNATDDENTLPQILLIEDNLDIVQYIRKILNNIYQVHVALDGEEGHTKAIELIPDIIISDVMMPKKNGFEVVADLKENNITNHIPIIILSAKARQQDVKDGLSVGADSYLKKPFDKEELLIRLRNIRKQQNILAQKYREGFFEDMSLIKTSTTKEETFLKKLKLYIKENLSNAELGNEDLQNHLDLSQKQLYRKTKAISGRSPSQLIRDLRLKEAERLLRENNLNISEIAYQTGFTDPNYFSRVFNKAYNISPSQYRDKHN